MIIQRAWTFVPAEFHEALASRVVRGSLDLERLWREAVSVCADPSPEIQSYLEMLRVDRDDVVISDDPPEVDHYVICMARHLTPIQAISGGGLGESLRKLGWARRWWMRLDSGDPLRTMVAQFSDPLALIVRDHLEIKYGGWLSRQAASEVLGRLHDVSDDFMNPSQRKLEEMLSYLRPRYEEDTLRAHMRQSYVEATRMLEQVTWSEDAALRLITD